MENFIKHQIIHYTEIDSTNDEASRRILAKNALDGDILIADRQTGGKGTHGRSFYSEDGLYMSIIRTSDEPGATLTAFVAVCVARAIDSLFGCKCKIKWVNDIYIEGKKLCGILCKRMFLGEKSHTIIGIGINTNTESFPEGLNAVSLKNLGFGNIDNLALAKEIAKNIDLCQDYMDEYRSRSCILGKECTVSERDGTRRHGTALRIDDDGALILLTADGEIRILAGDTEI